VVGLSVSKTSTKTMGEVKEHKLRGGAPYSEGHRRMYTTIAEILGNRPAKILEIGFGIGYGLEQLFKSKCIEDYFGVEIDKECVDFVENLMFHFEDSYDDKSVITLKHADWLEMPIEELEFFPDFTLCIEVMEHIKEAQWLPFLQKIKPQTKHALFLSTPNKNTHRHGVMSVEKTRRLILAAGFNSVAQVEWQWTTLYVCNPK